MPPSLHASVQDTDPFAGFDFETLSKGDQYKLLASVVLPRPIAWVVTRNAAGEVNAAPYSFFNVLSSDPPLLAISFSNAPDREDKDSLHYLRERGQFVVNLVPEELAEAMNLTATNAPRGTDETVLAKLALADSQKVNVPRIAGSPVALECELFREIDTGGSATIVLGRVVYAQVRESAFESLEKLHLEPAQMRLIGRMHGGGGYCTTRDVFNVDRRSWPLKSGSEWVRPGSSAAKRPR